MTHYLDTSALVKLYVEESGSRAVRGLFESDTELATCRLSVVEAASAFSRRARTVAGASRQLARVTRQLSDDLATMRLVEVTPEIIDGAAKLCAVHALRAYDAVHLSSAKKLSRDIVPELVFVCADRTLAAAAEEEGLAILVPAD